MASNNISKYYKVDGGLDLTSDSQFATLSANEKIVYKPSGEKYIKNSNYTNVFDKTDTFGDLETKIKGSTKAVGTISDADDNGVASYYNVTGNKIGEFKCGLPIIGSDGKTNVTAITRNGDILTVEVPRVYYDKYGRVTKWDKQVASVVVSSGSSSGVGYTGVPVGTISMWAGVVGDIPAGWHLCDGTNGTPDLRNRFVVGAGASYNPGNIGYPSGSTSVSIPVDSETVKPGTTISAVHKPSSWQNGMAHRCAVGDVVSGSELYSSYTNNSHSSYTLSRAYTDANHMATGAWKCVKSSYIDTDYAQSDGVTYSIIRQWERGTFEKVDDSAGGSDATNISISTNIAYYALCYIMKVQTDGSPTVVSNNNPELLWGQTLTVGAVDGKALTVRMPANPDTKYYAGTGLGLNGTTFYIDENWLKTFIGNNGGSGSGGGSYTVGARYGGTWYISGSGTNGLKSSSSIYSELEIKGGGCSHGASYTLKGDHPPSGTYYCEMIRTDLGESNSSRFSSCYIYTITYN